MNVIWLGNRPRTVTTTQITEPHKLLSNLLKSFWFQYSLKKLYTLKNSLLFLLMIFL